MTRVLIVDDDKWFAESLGVGLKDQFKVAIVQSAEAIFPAVERFHPDLLVLDLILGDKNALTFLNEFVSYDDLNSVKIVILSSVAHDLERVDLLKAGATAVLDKAEITPESLRKTLESLR
jgi:DNA-binding response OmpR family regulator